MKDQLFDDAVRDWLEDGSDRTPSTAIHAVLLAVKTTPQERDLRIPRRFNLMPTYLRLVAGIAIVAIVGVGVLAFNTRLPGSGSSTPVPPTATPVPSAIAPGISGWSVYHSGVNGITLGYPSDWNLLAPATREWKDGDVFPSEEHPYADIFVSPAEGDEQIGIFVLDVTVGVFGKEADLGSIDGLKAWAQSFCEKSLSTDCATFADAAVPMCDNAKVIEGTDDSCKAAILVPTADWQFGFFRDRTSEWVGWDAVHVVIVARDDHFPSATPYGGSVQLLKSILTTLDVWTPGEHQKGRNWIGQFGTR
jgi:hypothetical protein